MTLANGLLPRAMIFFIVTAFCGICLCNFLRCPYGDNVLPVLFTNLLLMLTSRTFKMFLFKLFAAIHLTLDATSL